MNYKLLLVLSSVVSLVLDSLLSLGAVLQARAAWTALQRRGHEGIGVLMPAAAHHFNLSFGGMRPKTPHSRPCVTALRTVAQAKPLIQSLG